MMRLIDADDAKARLKPYSKDDEKWSVTGGTALRLIHNALDNSPTIDAVPVVRCKDCRYCDVYNTVDVFAICQKTGETFIPFGTDIRKHFCAYGERKETGHDDGTL